MDALRILDVDDFPRGKMSRNALLRCITDMGISARQLASALRQVRPPPSHRQPQGGRGAGARSPGARSGSGRREQMYDKIPSWKIREVLNMVGVQDSGGLSKKELTELLHETGLLPQDMRTLRGRASAFPKQPRRPARRSRGPRDVFSHVDERPPRRRHGAKEFGRHRFHDDFDDLAYEDFDDVEVWLYETDDEDEDDDDDYDDFYDFVLDDEPWGEESPRTSRSQRSRSRETWSSERQAGAPGFYSYDAFDGSGASTSSSGPGRGPSASARPPPWSAEPPPWGAEAFNTAGFPFDAGFPATPPETPEEAMARALREGWAPTRLTRSQASMLLGVSSAPSDAELGRAKRQSVLRWHPDRNPDNPTAGAAFQLVIAAADVLAK